MYYMYKNYEMGLKCIIVIWKVVWYYRYAYTIRLLNKMSSNKENPILLLDFWIMGSLISYNLHGSKINGIFHGWNKIIDDISWMKFISSLDLFT
jgi:hypothetical protein